MKKPILSIITVNYNNKNGLIKTLQSIKAQTYIDYEHIIIDANSTDGSKEVISEYSRTTPHLIYWISEPDKGIYDGMNKGISQANGEYLYFLNSGDYLLDGVLSNISFDGTQYIYGDVMLGEGREDIKNKHIAPPDYPSLYFFLYDSLPHQACFIHHSLFTNKLYDTRYEIISDWGHSFQSIILEKCSYRHIPCIVVEYDGNGVSSNYTTAQAERLQWLKDNLSEQLYSALMDIQEYNNSKFKSIIPIMNKTRKFQKRAWKLVNFLLKINTKFSAH